MTANGMAMFYDTHAHLDYPDYANDRTEVIARAHAAGIAKIILIGTSLDSSERAIRLAEQFPSVYAAVGWHPTEVMQAPADLRPALREYAKHPKVVAIGEIGLDYHHLPGSQGGNVRDTVNATPLDKFMLETDCPYLAPVPHRGHRCEPAYVKEISEVVAQVKGCSLEELSTATCQTAKDFFRKLS